MTGDVLIYHSEDNGEITFTNGRVEVTSGFESAAYLSLFGGNEVGPAWWGNDLSDKASEKYISETATILNGLPATTGNLLKVKDAVTRDLAWMLDEKIATKLDITVRLLGGNQIEIKVVVKNNSKRQNLTFVANWESIL